MNRSDKKHKMRATSHRETVLDGLRGWGALTVLAYHLLVEIYPPSAATAAALYRLAPFNGPLAVVIFFIVSGYSLSIGFLRTGERWRLKRIMVGRYFRLATPILIATLLVCLFANTGLILNEARTNGALSFVDSLRFALFSVFLDNHEPARTPIPQLWTMPVELAGSALVLFLLWITSSRRSRFYAYSVALLSLPWWSPFLAAFVVGVVLAEIGNGYVSAKVETIAGWLLIPSLWAATLLPGQGHLAYLAVATPIAFSAIFGKRCRVFLSNALSRFLGEISFPLYLLHGLVIFTFGAWSIREVALPLAYVATVGLSLLTAWAFRWMDWLGIRVARFVGMRLVRRPIPEGELGNGSSKRRLAS